MIIIGMILAYIVFSAIHHLIIITLLSILQSWGCGSTTWLRHWAHITISWYWCNLSNIISINWYFPNTRDTLNTCCKSPWLMLVLCVSLTNRLVKEALRKKDLRRLWFRSLVSVLWISSDRSIAWLVLSIVYIWIMIILVVINISCLCLLSFSIICWTSRSLMSRILSICTHLFLWIKWWCRFLHNNSKLTRNIINIWRH